MDDWVAFALAVDVVEEVGSGTCPGLLRGELSAGPCVGVTFARLGSGVRSTARGSPTRFATNFQGRARRGE